AWKPDLLTPVASAEQLIAMRPLVESLIGTDGSVRWVGLGSDEDLPVVLAQTIDAERVLGLHATWTRLRTEQFMEGVGLTLDALQSALFPPNLVVVDETRVSDAEIVHYLEHCRALSVGLALWLPHPNGGLGRREVIDVWISDRAPEWKLRLHLANLDLPVLIGFLLARAWGAKLRLWCGVRDPTQVDAGVAFLRDLVDQARLPSSTTVHVTAGAFMDALAASSSGDLNIFGMPPQITKARLAEIQTASAGSCLWLLDSGRESVLA
ncbi:MAG: solute carrier family 12 sodium/potassium/chloride transporter 2, partial [Myxococcota bacterium]